MSNVVNFPGYYRVEGFWLYAGKRWKDVRLIKDAVSARDWERIHHWDVRRFLRGEICNSHGGGYLGGKEKYSHLLPSGPVGQPSFARSEVFSLPERNFLRGGSKKFQSHSLSDRWGSFARS